MKKLWARRGFALWIIPAIFCIGLGFDQLGRGLAQAGPGRIGSGHDREEMTTVSEAAFKRDAFVNAAAMFILGIGISIFCVKSWREMNADDARASRVPTPEETAAMRLSNERASEEIKRLLNEK